MSQKFPKYLQHKTTMIGIEVECFIFSIVASYLSSIFISTNKFIMFVSYLILSIFLKKTIEKGLVYKMTIQTKGFEINE